MKIIIADKFGVDREILFTKEKNEDDDKFYFNLEMRINNDFNCTYDLDIDELEKIINILKNS